MFLRGMGVSILQLFPPLLLSPHSSSPFLMEDVRMFCTSLLEGLKKLEQSLVGGSISLRWSADVLNFLKQMQIELLAILKKFKLPISYGAEEDWFDQYMKETIALLDFCNSIKSVVSRISQYRMVLDLTIKQLLKADPSTMASAKDGLERLEREGRKLLDAAAITGGSLTGNVNGTVSSNKSDERISICTVMLAAKNTMTALSLLLVSAIASPVLLIDVGNEGCCREFPELEAFMVQLRSLIKLFHERASIPKGSSSLLLFEHQMVDRAVVHLKDQVVEGEEGDSESIRTGVELLRKRSVELKEGVELLNAAVDEVFDEVIRGRNEMLQTARDETLI